MNRKITYIIATIRFAMHFQAFAAPVDTNTARKAALTFMQTRKGFQQLQAKDLQLAYTSVEIREGKSEALYYVFNVGEHAFVTVAASDRSRPILAYSTTSRFEAERIPDNAKAVWLNFHDQIVKLNRETMEVPSDNCILWERLTSGENIFTTRSVQKAVEPLIQTTWSQSPYYNKFCPYDSNTYTNAITGCVATAMAQIIKYWAYPAKGFGHCAYTHPKYNFLSVNYEEANYQYDSMPVILDHNSSEAEVNAVARLMRDCGIGVGMNYSPSASGAQVIAEVGGTYSAEYVLTHHFGYVNSCAYYKYRYLSDWYKNLKNDLDNRRPVLMCGFDNDGGHAFICDGYDDFGLYHFNWGWNGYQDGYYLVDSANGYSSYQQAIFGLMPPYKLNTHHLVLGSTLQTDKDTVGCNDSFTLNVKVLNNGGKPFCGTFRLSLLNAQTKQEIISFDTVSCLQAPLTSNSSITMQFPISLNNLVSTNYLLALYYRDTIIDFNSNEWEPVGEIGDYTNEKVIRFDGGKTETVMETVSGITAHSATVSAHIDQACSEKIILKYIQYRKEKNGSFTNLKDTSNGNSIHLVIDNLTANTTYEVQGMVMVESNGIYNTYYSTNMLTFTTDDDNAVSGIKDNGILLSPNPAQTHLKIELPDNDTYQLDIYNSLGQKMTSRTCQGPEVTLETIRWEKGIYFIQIHSKSTHFTGKFVIE